MRANARNDASIFARNSATTDFCELNYTHSPHVAEWYGTWSAIGMVMIGSIGVCISLTHGIATRFVALWLLLAVVGLGTMYLHATLAFFAMACDELPMIGTALSLFYCLLTAEDGSFEATERVVLALFLVGFGSAMGGWSLATKYLLDATAEEPIIFPLIFGGIMTMLILQELCLYAKYSQRHLRRLYERAAITFILGFGSWLIDQSMCESVRSLHLHSWWHLLTAASAHYTFVWVVGINAASKGETLPRSLLTSLPAVHFFPLSDNTEADYGQPDRSKEQ